MVLTRSNGRPIERPIPPPAGAPLDAKLAYLRALWAFNDEVGNVANAAFVEGFKQGVR